MLPAGKGLSSTSPAEGRRKGGRDGGMEGEREGRRESVASCVSYGGDAEGRRQWDLINDNLCC